MYRAATIALTVLILISGLGVAQVGTPDYLEVTEYRVSPSISARIGDPVAAYMVLEKVGPIPVEAKLNISTDVVGLRGEVKINNKTEGFYSNNVELSLPPQPDGVRRIEIRLSGYAPKVEKLTDIKVLEVKTYVFYDNENKGYQEEKVIFLSVTNFVISGAVEAINSAKGKLETAEKAVGDLKAAGIRTSSLEDKLKNAKDLLSTAEALYKKGDVQLAKSNAESAMKILDEIVSEAGDLKAGKETKSNLARYGLIGVGIIVIAGLLFLLMRRREELG